MKKKVLSIMFACSSLFANSQAVVDFEHLPLSGSNSYWNGSGTDAPYMLTSGGIRFGGVYATAYGGYWKSGWAFSKVNNTTLAGHTNMYAAITGTASGTYAIGQQNAQIEFDEPSTLLGLDLTNTTYAYLSMRDGDSFAKQFSTVAGGDFFKLTLYPILETGVQTASGVDVYLADFRTVSGNNFILNTLTSVNLNTWGTVLGVRFELSSSDVGPFGINTPLFFVLDNMSVAGVNGVQIADFEDAGLAPGARRFKVDTDIPNNFSVGNFTFKTVFAVSNWGDYWKGGFAYTNSTNNTLAGSNNLYGNITGKGFNNSEKFAIGQQNASIVLSVPGTVSGTYITNTTYAYFSMLNGDSFAKKFGGTAGTDPDFFKLTIKGFRNGTLTDSAEVYLADFRFTDDSNDYILNQWTWVDLAKIGVVDSVSFKLSSSDVGMYGINTPLFFALDDWNGTAPVLNTVTGIAASSTIGEICHVYPNPVTDVAKINLNAALPYVILDVTGKAVAFGMGNDLLDVRALPQGLYFVRAKDGKSCRFLKR